MSYSLNSLKRGLYGGTIIGVITGDTKSLDYGSDGLASFGVILAMLTGPCRAQYKTAVEVGLLLQVTQVERAADGYNSFA